MKTDADLKEDVTAELAWDPKTNAAAIGVAVKDAVVTLCGHLDSDAEKCAIERAAPRRRRAGREARRVKASIDGATVTLRGNDLRIGA